MTDTPADRPARGNRLLGETSPYLQQHAQNPVDWYPWGEEALRKAAEEDKPVFLSIGYSACHWCHVMERESFENEEIAGFLNRHFVSIKVDREERPDLDELYMAAVQLIGGHGGWPLSVWLTPDLRPFYGGTYFPPQDRGGHIGFLSLLQRLLEVYKLRRDEAESAGRRLAEHIASFADLPASGAALLTTAPLQAAGQALLRAFDRTYGGFGPAPKFPGSMGIQLLLRLNDRSGDLELARAARESLEAMARGGIYDHLGGGFHRYSTDARWLVPHFEKMLYDQALLSLAYLEAHQTTGRAGFARVVRETLDYVLREMTSPEGGFYSTEDADSEGEEGRFYLWTPGEIREVLGERRGAEFCRAYGVDEEGNFEGRSILHRTGEPEEVDGPGPAMDAGDPLAPERELLRRRRGERVRPLRDEKILTAWNSLIIVALARAGWVLEEERYLAAAVRAADFLLARMRPDGLLLRVFRNGRAHTPAYLEDYAGLLCALVELHQAGFEPRWLETAEELAGRMLREFGHPAGGFFNTSERHTHLFARPRNAQDGSVPSGNSLAALALLRLGRLLDRRDLEEAGEGTLRAFLPLMQAAPGAFHQMLLALDLYLGPRQEIVLIGPPEHETMRGFRDLLRRCFLPRAVVAAADEASGRGALFAGKTLMQGLPAAYLCRGDSCLTPARSPEELGRQIEEVRRELRP